MFFNITRYERGSKLRYVFLKEMTPNYLAKIVSSHYEEGEVPAEFVLKVEEYYFFYQAIDNRFQHRFRITVFVIDFSRKITLRLFRQWK